jgi:hypothetical protein
MAPPSAPKQSIWLDATLGPSPCTVCEQTQAICEARNSAVHSYTPGTSLQTFSKPLPSAGTSPYQYDARFSKSPASAHLHPHPNAQCQPSPPRMVATSVAVLLQSPPSETQKGVRLQEPELRQMRPPPTPRLSMLPDPLSLEDVEGRRNFMLQRPLLRDPLAGQLWPMENLPAGARPMKLPQLEPDPRCGDRFNDEMVARFKCKF